MNWVVDLKQSSSTDVAETTRQRQEDELNETDEEETATGEISDEDYERLGNQFAAFLSGGSIQEAPKPEETAYFGSDQFEDFSLPRVLLGYGIPTLLSIALALFCFQVRDL